MNVAAATHDGHSRRSRAGKAEFLAFGDNAAVSYPP